LELIFGFLFRWQLLSILLLLSDALIYRSSSSFNTDEYESEIFSTFLLSLIIFSLFYTFARFTIAKRESLIFSMAKTYCSSSQKGKIEKEEEKNAKRTH
jgi:hypothetical protein